MRLSLTAAVVAVGLCLIAAGVSKAAVTTASAATYALKPCSTCKEVRYPTELECRAAAYAEAQRVGLTRESGSAVYTCITRFNVIATFKANAPAPVPVNCVVSEWGAWSDPPWLACADGFQSRSIVRTRTIVTQPANGGTACPLLVETQPQTRVCPGTAIVSWTHDGLNTTEYRITHWRDGELPQVHRVAGNLARRAVIDGLPAGAWSFHVSATYCPSDPQLICNMSNPSETGSKAIL